MKLFNIILSLTCAFVLASCNPASVNSQPNSIIVKTDTKKISNKQKIPTILFYYASWCPYCQKASPVVEQLEKEYNGKIYFYHVDVDSKEGKELAKTFKNGQDGVPHFQFYGKDGSMMEERMGLMPYELLKQRIAANYKI